MTPEEKSAGVGGGRSSRTVVLLKSRKTPGGRAAWCIAIAHFADSALVAERETTENVVASRSQG